MQIDQETRRELFVILFVFAWAESGFILAGVGSAFVVMKNVTALTPYAYFFMVTTMVFLLNCVMFVMLMLKKASNAEAHAENASGS